jgi:hypothetical protein
MGTMIALLPNLGAAILGSGWIAGEYDFLGSFFTLLILFGSIFVVGVFLILVVKIWFEGRDEEESIPDFKIFSVKVNWHRGDNSRLALSFCLFPFFLGFIGFVFPALVLIPNFYSVFTLIIVIPVFFTLIMVFLMRLTFEQIVKVSQESGKWKKVVFNTLMGFTLLYLIALFLFVYPGYLVEQSHNNEIRIVPERSYFSPSESAVKGLRLDVSNISGRDQIFSTTFNWSTNYGYFLTTNSVSPDSYILGDKVESMSTRIYWTYPLSEINDDKPPVKINLVVKNLKNNSIITTISLNLTWFNHEIAFVNYSIPHEIDNPVIPVMHISTSENLIDNLSVSNISRTTFS